MIELTEETNLNCQKLNNKIKIKAVDDFVKNQPKLFIKNFLIVMLIQLPLGSNDIDITRKNIHCARSSILSMLPTSIEDVHELLKKKR